MMYICARHGESDTNFRRVVSGPETNPELTQLGKSQAKELAYRLVSFDIGRIITSDHKRALQTAEIVDSVLRVELVTTPHYRERSFGVHIGTPLTEDWKFLYETNEGLETFEELKERFSKMPEIRNGDLLIGHGVSTPLFLDFVYKRPMGKNFVRFGNCEYKVFTTE